jgi:hypothetical protein
MPQDVQELAVWHRAIDLTVRVYKLTREFPKDEIYGLVSQLPVPLSPLPATLQKVEADSANEGSGSFLAWHLVRFLK